MIIGVFHTAPEGFTGSLQSLSFNAELEIVPALSSDTDNAPDWRIMMRAGEANIEVGAGWNRKGARAGDYIAVQIDDPALPRSLRANLVRAAQDESFLLLWSRPKPRSQK